MAKEKSEGKEKYGICTSVFQKGNLTKEDYTGIWIELIQASERRKENGIS